MAQESKSDLFGPRKDFLSAGVTFWGKPQSASDIREDALRRPDWPATFTATLLHRLVVGVSS